MSTIVGFLWSDYSRQFQLAGIANGDVQFQDSSVHALQKLPFKSMTHQHPTLPGDRIRVTCMNVGGFNLQCCYNLTWLPQYHCGGSLWNGYRVTLLSIFATSKICTWNVLKTRAKTAIWICMISCVQLKHLYPAIGQCSCFQHFNTNLFGESEKCWDYYWLILNSNILMLFPKSIILAWHTLLNSSDMPMALE